jgi:hypothetical protein
VIDLVVIGIERAERVDKLSFARRLRADGPALLNGRESLREIGGGGTPNGLSNKLVAMPQYAMAQSGSALRTSSKISFDARYQNECW